MKFAKLIFSLLDGENTKKDIFYFLNALILSLVGIYIFFAPFPASAVNEMSFYLSVTLVVLLMILKKTDFSLKTPLSIPFAIFVVWSAITIFFAINKGNSSHDVYAHLIKYIVVYFLVVNYFNSQKRFILLAWVIIISAAIFSYGGIIYFYILKDNSIYTRFTNPDYIPYRDFIYVFAIILAVYLFLKSTSWIQKLLLAICIVGAFAATLFTQTRSALIGLVVALGILLFKKKKAFFLIIIFLSVLLIFIPKLGGRFSTNDIMLDKVRISNHLLFIEMIKDNPITGIGFGMQTYQSAELLNVYNQRVPDKYKQKNPVVAPHNILVDISARLGIPGLLFFLYILFTFFRMSWTTALQREDNFIREWGRCITAAFVAFFIQGMFADGEFGLQAIVQYTILAMMTILWQLNVKSDIALQPTADTPFI
jgi:O-antigen ligase